MDTIKFEAGKTYWTRSICDYDCIFQITVAKRVGKCTIVTTEGQRLRCSVYDGKEQVKPRGNYSMCPIIDASDCGPLPGSKAEPVKEEPQTLAQLMAEGEKLFSPEDFEAVKNVVRGLGVPEHKISGAKVYNFADYKKK